MLSEATWLNEGVSWTPRCSWITWCVWCSVTSVSWRTGVCFQTDVMSFDAVHSVVKKVAQYMADVLEDSRDKVQENLLANGGDGHWCVCAMKWSDAVALNLFSLCFLVDLITYVTRFQWDMAKYPIKQSLKHISEIVSKARDLIQCFLWWLTFSTHCLGIAIFILYQSQPSLLLIMELGYCFKWSSLLLRFTSKSHRSTTTWKLERQPTTTWRETYRIWRGRTREWFQTYQTSSYLYGVYYLSFTHLVSNLDTSYLF